MREPIKVGREDIGRVVILRQTLKRGVIIGFDTEYILVIFNGQKRAWEVRPEDLFYDPKQK